MRGVSANVEIVLQSISKSAHFPDFTLIGGTALSLTIGHRLSEDLDFCTWDKDYRLEADTMANHLNQLEGNFTIVQLLNSEYQLDFLVNGVKVTLFKDPLGIQPPFEVKHKFNQLRIADLYSIGGMKACASLSRSKFRDYYDLFCLSHDHIPISDILASALSFRPHYNSRIVLQNLTSLNEAKDESLELLKPIYKVSRREIESFFRQIVRPEKLRTPIGKMNDIFKPAINQQHYDYHNSHVKIELS